MHGIMHVTHAQCSSCDDVDRTVSVPLFHACGFFKILSNYRERERYLINAKRIAVYDHHNYKAQRDDCSV
jgi:hypothetical protein